VYITKIYEDEVDRSNFAAWMVTFGTQQTLYRVKYSRALAEMCKQNPQVNVINVARSFQRILNLKTEVAFENNLILKSVNNNQRFRLAYFAKHSFTKEPTAKFARQWFIEHEGIIRERVLPPAPELTNGQIQNLVADAQHKIRQREENLYGKRRKARR
jgi:hypothetical protein